MKSHFSKYGYESREKVYQAIRNMTVEDLKSYVEKFKVGIENSIIATKGSKIEIDKSKDLFEVIHNGLD